MNTTITTTQQEAASPVDTLVDPLELLRLETLHLEEATPSKAAHAHPSLPALPVTKPRAMTKTLSFEESLQQLQLVGLKPLFPDQKRMYRSAALKACGHLCQLHADEKDCCCCSGGSRVTRAVLPYPTGVCNLCKN